MDIRRGGKTISIEPGPPPIPEKTISHNAYMAWDCFLDMVRARNEAVALWERAVNLSTLIDANRTHKNVPEALRRRDMVVSRMRELQLRFLRSENIAEGYWKTMPLKERRQEAMDDMFGVEVDAPSILGAWHRQLGESEGAPQQCRMDATVLQFVPPSVARSYRRAEGS